MNKRTTGEKEKWREKASPQSSISIVWTFERLNTLFPILNKFCLCMQLLVFFSVYSFIWLYFQQAIIQFCVCVRALTIDFFYLNKWIKKLWHSHKHSIFINYLSKVTSMANKSFPLSLRMSKKISIASMYILYFLFHLRLNLTLGIEIRNVQFHPKRMKIAWCFVVIVAT